jgi:hypothetical protein
VVTEGYGGKLGRLTILSHLVSPKLYLELG